MVRTEKEGREMRKTRLAMDQEWRRCIDMRDRGI
jgi:hypothetical protein